MNPQREEPPQDLPLNDDEKGPVELRGDSAEPPLAVAPIGSVSSTHLPEAIAAPAYPLDLQITWSWPHLVLFLLFSFISLVLVQGLLALHYAPKHQRLSAGELESYLIAKSQFAIGSMLIWYAVIFFFLYV